MKWKKTATGQWQSDCGKYEVNEMCEPIPDGAYSCARIDWNMHLGVGTKKGMQALCEEHDQTN
tara:strand:- start:146 stop:334 length:189 start_codon:yes stop_codon:yes gene_type:complete